ASARTGAPSGRYSNGVPSSSTPTSAVNQPCPSAPSGMTDAPGRATTPPGTGRATRPRGPADPAESTSASDPVGPPADHDISTRLDAAAAASPARPGSA